MNISYIFLLFLLGNCYAFYGQYAGIVPIQVLANEHTTTTLFFPSAIAKTIHPTVNYQFEYQDDEPNLGLLKGGKGSPSNLTVITDNGYIYSFALQYSANIETFHFMLTTDMAVGRTQNHKSRSVANEEGKAMIDPRTEKTDEHDISVTKPLDITLEDMDSDSDLDSLARTDDNRINVQGPLTEEDETYANADHRNLGITDGENDLYDIDRKEYYRIFCENNYLQKTIFRRTFRQNNRIVLKLNNILVDRNEVYFVLQVENNSKNEFRVNGLGFFREKGVGLLQKIMKPLYIFNLQDKIDPQSINEVVFVFKRFNMSNKEKVYVVLDELENNRMVVLPLDNRQINAPTH